jgi:dihydroxyacetone synthase
MEACGWEIIDVEDGVNDVDAIVSAMEKGRDPNRSKPLFINVRSIIGIGSAKAGQAGSHGAPLGTENVIEMKKAYGWDTTKKYHIPEKVKEFYAEIPARGDRWEQSSKLESKAGSLPTGRNSSRRASPLRIRLRAKATTLS